METMRALAVAALAIVILAAGSGCWGSYLRVSDDPIADLSSSDPNHVALAAIALAESDDETQRRAALPKLCELLRHPDPLVRSAATCALRAVTGCSVGYEPYRDPCEQDATIHRWAEVLLDPGEGTP